MAIGGGSVGSWTIGGPEEEDDGGVATIVDFVEGPTVAVLASSITMVVLSPSITGAVLADSITSVALERSVTSVSLL